MRERGRIVEVILVFQCWFDFHEKKKRIVVEVLEEMSIAGSKGAHSEDCCKGYSTALVLIIIATIG